MISFAGKQAFIRLTLLRVLLVLILILLTRVASAGKYFIIHYAGTLYFTVRIIPLFLCSVFPVALLFNAK